MFLYLIPAIGFTVTAHYCGGKITSVSLKLIDTHKCPCGKKAMKKDCCKDEAKTFKLKGEQLKASLLSFNLTTATDLQPIISDNVTFFYQSSLVQSDFTFGSHPPDDLKHPLYIRHRVFRI